MTAALVSCILYLLYPVSDSRFTMPVLGEMNLDFAND
jgi:hypothetical protein